MKNKITLLLFINILPLFIYAAGIEGYVRDFETNEPLVGATVTIKGTTIGTVTDFNGHYEILSIKPGTYTFAASYIGYEMEEVEFAISEKEVINHDFKLVSSSFNMAEVTVTVQAKGQIKALNQQLNSDYISNVVSSERLQEVPDATVADALARIPGVTVTSNNGEGDKVQIRGMEPRLNLVTINGVRSPSTSEEDGSVSMSGISPFMIESIEVQKSLTPDKDGDVVGGIVDMKIKDAEEGFKVNMVFQNNINSIVNSNFNPRATLQLSNRFFNNKLGVAVVGNYEDIDRSSERMSAAGITKNYGYLGQDAGYVRLESGNFWTSEFSRQRFGGSLYLDYKLPNGKINVSSFANGLNDEEITRMYVWTDEDNQSRNLGTSKTNTLSLVNALQIEHKMFWDSEIKAGVSYTSADREMPENYALNTRWGKRNTENRPAEIAALYTDNPMSYPYDIQVMVDALSDSSFFMSNLTSTDNTFKESELTTFVDWKIPLNLSDYVNGNIKVGFKYRDKKREYDAASRGTSLTGGAQDEAKQFMVDNYPVDYGRGVLVDYIGANNFGTVFLLDDYDVKILDDQFHHHSFIDPVHVRNIVSLFDDDNWSIDPVAALPEKSMTDDYSGSEQVTAGYGMVDLNLTKYVQLVGGVRIEDYKTDYRSFGVYESGISVYDFETFDDSLAVRQNSFVLPMVNLKIKPLSWLQFRLAYTKSIARPRYYSYMPRYFLTRLGEIQNVGNPMLKPALSNNLDAYVSVKINDSRFGLAGVLTTGVFTKKIIDYEYTKSYVNTHDSVNAVHPYYDDGEGIVAKGRLYPIRVPINNPEPAYSRGFEIDWQGSFIYLPKPLNGLVLNANYTFSETEQTQYKQLLNTYAPDPSTPWVTVTEVTDSAYSAAMFNQPKHIINASLGYDFRGFSARIAYTRKSEHFVGYFGQGLEVENERLAAVHQSWDLSVTQKIKWVDGLQLFLNMSNMTATYNKKEFVNVRNREPFPLSEEYFGRITIVGLRYNM